jgi:hypothetical protein
VLLLYALRLPHRRLSAGLAGAAAFAAIGFAHVIWWVPIGQHRHAELHLAGAQLLFANAYVLIALLALSGPLRLIRPGRSVPDAEVADVVAAVELEVALAD